MKQKADSAPKIGKFKLFNTAQNLRTFNTYHETES